QGAHGRAVSAPQSVIVKDAHGNPVSLVAVTDPRALHSFTTRRSSDLTNASGVATVGGWTLSATAGPNTLTATSGSLSGSPVTFTDRKSTRLNSSHVKNSDAGYCLKKKTAVSAPPSVIVKDANGNPEAQ